MLAYMAQRSPFFYFLVWVFIVVSCWLWSGSNIKRRSSLILTWVCVFFQSAGQTFHNNSVLVVPKVTRSILSWRPRGKRLFFASFVELNCSEFLSALVFPFIYTFKPFKHPNNRHYISFNPAFNLHNLIFTISLCSNYLVQWNNYW